MRYDTVLFDLDGTLTDPKEGITKAIAYALRHFGVEVSDLSTLEKFIGPPLHEAFPEFYGFDKDTTAAAIGKFREYYNVYGWCENVPYEGLREFLESLRASGLRLAMATSKPEATARRVAEHFGFASQLALICGAPVGDEAAAKKSAVIRNALARLGVSDVSGVVMVGDRKHDISGAHEVGLPAVGVLWGYGSREELMEAKADELAADFEELRATLLRE